jgi:hypothetical protein
VAVVRIAGNVAQQRVHGLVQVFVVAIGHLQLIVAIRPPLG